MVRAALVNAALPVMTSDSIVYFKVFVSNSNSNKAKY
jgi:hypothetical protein